MVYAFRWSKTQAFKPKFSLASARNKFSVSKELKSKSLYAESPRTETPFGFTLGKINSQFICFNASRGVKSEDMATLSGFDSPVKYIFFISSSMEFGLCKSNLQIEFIPV